MDVSMVNKRNEGRNDGNNGICGKNYAAGILPVCVSATDGQVMVLLGLQPRGSGKAECMVVGQEAKALVDGVWCVFWGWQDKGDIDEEHTAAREAEEESAGLLGPRDSLRSFLIAHPESRTLPCLYSLFCGILSPEQMTGTEEEFYHMRWRTSGLSVSRREMSAVKWFSLAEMETSLRMGSDRMYGMKAGTQSLRSFLHKWFLRTVNVFSSDPLFVSLRNGGARDVSAYGHLLQNVIPCGVCGVVLNNAERRYRKQRCNPCFDLGKKGRTPCRFFTTPQGCRKGETCPFMHSASK